ncbi:Putative 115 kDa protein in type-1 retrotransposable element R1DM [Eumeta japonica]|uniref:115 kDa protein in type-1 retrotransposable element R1DM n=1 Tax=Eumeta variegata TaxID=151549 RepID=A0A4C1WS11_EUMVA|nr:Putative 115 kDa protein in type-1 retrotransposable element R1DM [Eumeta japonica]
MPYGIARFVIPKALRRSVVGNDFPREDPREDSVGACTGLRGGISGNQHGFVPGRSTSTALNDILGVEGSAAKYVQLIFLDISGAFDNAWWPMGGVPRWRRSRGRGPQWGAPGSVLGPALWNVLLDDLLRLPFPAGVKTVAYADDVTVLVEASSRAEIERRSAQALDLMQDWGRRNRLAFAPAKSCTMTVKGRLQRPPIVRMGGDSIRTVSAATVLGLVLDEHLFAQHAQSIGEGVEELRQATYLTTLTYVAGAGTSVQTARSTQCPAEDTEASLGVTDQGLQDHREREGRTAAEVRVLRRRVRDEMIELWQRDWDEEKNGRELYRYFPDVSARLSFGWVEPD